MKAFLTFRLTTLVQLLVIAVGLFYAARLYQHIERSLNQAVVHALDQNTTSSQQ